MKRQEKPVFAEVLAEVHGGEPVKLALQPRFPTPIQTVPTEDSLNISVQGRKAFRRRTGGNRQLDSFKEDVEKKEDWQGNRLRLSQAGIKLAQDVEESVAWETRLERKKV